MPIEALKAKQYSTKTTLKANDTELNKTLKGVLVNNYMKAAEEQVSFSDVQDSLLICDTTKFSDVVFQDNDTPSKESSFNTKKALLPLIIGTATAVGSTFLTTSLFKHASNAIKNTKPFEQLPDIGINMNIKDEIEFSLYRAIKNPSYRNILGAAGVIIMTAATICGKNFIDGAKDIWLKKQSADIEKNLQENLIEVETESFSGKLQVVNDMMKKNVKYFDNIFNSQKATTDKKPVFSDFVSFGKNSEEKESASNDNSNKKQDIKFALVTAGVLLGTAILGKMSISNLKKLAKNNEEFATNYTKKTIDAILEASKNPNEKDLPNVIQFLKSICAKPEFVKEIGEKYKLSPEKIEEIINSVEQTHKQICADAPAALGGIPSKISYYCYLDESRGHLYNMITNPDNIFTKLIFYTFAISGSARYIFESAMEAIKDKTVLKENAKTDLDLRKRLVNVEIKNFKAKKESAINPLIEDFEAQFNSGKKSKEELKQLADNILFETKNGPPYVYT